MRFTSIAFALLGVVATASAATTLEARGDGFPHCVQKCHGNRFGCNPKDWDCFCKNNNWKGWFEGCCKDNCHGDDFHRAGKTVGKHCRKAKNPWGW
ncbi:hypothetical protein M413DRAFT_443672 [Hebeloma cylindrosporum]|uniref:CFEM domain-containing protein n=1 Tax=Hebeloma cylindrosporum TaxID=76867 RepID=A0A0C2Y1P3_HEBCY|nr:hypothetical protein M413DRAFT_443672 [Hebeloma cylindrosporum h7]